MYFQLRSARLLSLLIVVGLNCCLISCLAQLRLHHYPIESRTLYLHHFSNRSFEPDINRKLTEIVRQEGYRRKNFILVRKRQKAALFLYGEVSIYIKKRRFHDTFRNTSHYEIQVACLIKLRENKSYQRLKSDGSLLVSETLRARTIFSSSGRAYQETESSAQERLFQILALKIHRSLEQSFQNKNQRLEN